MTENYSTLIKSIEEYNKKNNSAVEIKYNEAMSRHTTFRIGGNADLYLIPHTVDALVSLCAMLKETDGRRYFLGNGSNVLFDDNCYRGAVVSLSELNRITADGNVLTAQAGASLNLLCKTARDHSLTGLEFAYGIPGSVGGAVFMNAGAYGGEISSVIKESTYLSPDDMTLHTIGAAEHSYGYRDSMYRHNNFIILSASFGLQTGNSDEISAQMTDYMNRRVEKQPLEYPSAGSVFKRYPGRFTGQMIDECGLKGYSIGGAQVSEKHAGFIINKGNASCADVLALIEHIQNEVYKKFGCRIECEVIYVR
ncbi:MAG: UDP-N-acetylmuramate dehydrogenase [Eubacteriales bacterium]